MEDFKISEMGFKNWFCSPLFNKKKWFLFMIIASFIGVVLGLIMAGVLYGLQKDKDPNLTYQASLNCVIIPALYTGVAIVFLWVANIRFVGMFPIELLILSAIFISGLFSTISSKNASLVFIGIGVIFLYLVSKVFVPPAICAIGACLGKFFGWISKLF